MTTTTCVYNFFYGIYGDNTKQQFSNLQFNNHLIQMWDCLYINQDKQQVYLHQGGSEHLINKKYEKHKKGFRNGEQTRAGL